jgi:hypothetical protein
MKKINTSLMLLILNLAFSQVGISKNQTVEIHNKAILQIDGKYEGKSFGMMLPEVSHRKIFRCTIHLQTLK